MNEWLRKCEYISPTIIDELIKLMGKAILRSRIGEEIASKNNALIADYINTIYNICRFS